MKAMSSVDWWRERSATHTQGPHTRTYSRDTHTLVNHTPVTAAVVLVYHHLVFHQRLQLCLTSCVSMRCCGATGRKTQPVLYVRVVW